MADSSTLQTLQVALDANAAAYRRAVQSSAPGECWDFLTLTATNEKQASGYRQELALRQRAVGPTGAFFPAIQKATVVADPPGPRIGSGGATLNAIRHLIESHGVMLDDFDRLHLLLIHSGGMSQRLPMYSPVGKIFAPLPLLRPDGQIATLFDHLYLTLAGLPERLGPGMLILAGDVFLLMDHRHVTAPPPGVTAISMRVDAELGRGHGVFVTDERGRITRTLQKVSVDAMRLAGAVDDQHRVLIDTGLLFFDPDQLRRLAKLAGLSGSARRRATVPLHQRHRRQLDLYEDITAALAVGARRKAFVGEGPAAPMRAELWAAMHGIDFQAMRLDGEFLHLGTTLQFRDAMVGHNPSPAAELFQQDVLAHCQWPLEPQRRVYHSALLDHDGQSGRLGRDSVVEHSILRAPATIGQGGVVSQVLARDTSVDLPDDRLFFQVPVRTSEKSPAYAQVVCGVRDDFKGRFSEGKCLFLEAPIEQWMKRHSITARELWPGDAPEDQRTLWSARVFPTTARRDAPNPLLPLCGAGAAPAKLVKAWRSSERLSMAMILELADPAAMIEHREMVAAYLQAGEMIDVIRRREDMPVESVIGHYSTAAAYDAADELLRDFANSDSAESAAALDQARAAWSAGQLLQRPDHPNLPDARRRIESTIAQAFSKVALASEVGHRSADIRIQDPPARPDQLSPGVEVTAASPVRIDLAGGWSDTPPFCFERGGHVINVAIDLDGQPPVRAIVRTLAQPRLIVESHDLGRWCDLCAEPAALAAVDVHDPFSLHKIALNMTGILPDAAPDASRRLRQRMRSLGAGLHVTTSCRVPKGSGLGTSSILAATLLGALHQLIGRRPTHEQLIEQTLVLEQRLSTGGGWQDQVGGIVPGIKSAMSVPGVPQRPVVEALRLGDARYAELEQRLVIYFSGQQRLARDILRRVMGRWLGREPAVMLLMRQLTDGAAALRQALLKGRWTAVAEEIDRYWRIKKELYPGSTTPGIDVLLLELREHYLAAGLAGAGGGGFAYFFCRCDAQARRLRELLERRSARPGSLGSVYQTRINRTGLTISTQRVKP